MATASAVVFVGPRQVAVREVDVRHPGDGEVLVRTSYSGISAGTELLAYRGEVDDALALDETIGALGGTFAYPFPFGYSCVGRVEASRCAVPEGSLVFAFHPHQDRFVAGGDDVVPVGDDVAPRVATLFPLVETALQVALDARPVLGDEVVVLGLGAVGILAAAMIGRAGGRVLGVDPLAWRRDAAAGLGVASVHPDDLTGALDGRRVPLLVEATGRPDVLGPALDLLAHEGTALVVSWYGTKPVALPLGGPFHRRRLTIRSTQVSTIPAHLGGRWTVARRRAEAARLLAALPLGGLATHEFPLERAAEAYEALDGGRDGLVHAALCYG